MGSKVMKIAFIGLGTMGLAMASNLVKAGFEVVAWNRSPEPVQILVKKGASAADTAMVAVEEADILISMLANDEAVNSVMTEPLLTKLAKNQAIHINMATVSVELAKQQAALHKKHQVGYISAPVLGRVDVAEAAQLNILAAGKQDDLQKVQTILDTLGQKTWYFGEDPAQANVVKVAANFMIMCVIESLGESFALVDNYHVKKQDFLEMLTQTLFTAPVYKNYGRIICEEAYTPAGFKLTLGLKDTHLALEAGNNAHVPLPFASVIRDNFLDAIAQGDSHLDWSALAKVAKRRAEGK